ncbi:MAG: zf-HC2 domain-containing protein [Armatimonadetes bacterium]|nr:zf-HC2 domain-containing protein [Armatimonadota bacterium]
MDCRETRETLLPYLLGELTPEEMMEIGQHLHSCKDCSLEKNSLAAHITKIAAAFNVVPDCLDKSFARRIVAQSREQQQRKRVVRWRWATAAAAAVVCLAVVASLLLHQSGPSPTATVQIAGLLADYRQYVDKPNPAQMASANAEVVSAWLSKELGFRVHAVDLSNRGITLLGGRRCELNGAPLAFLFYEKGETRITVYQIKGARFALEKLDTKLCNGHKLHVGRFGNTTLVACQSGDRTVVVIAELETEELIPIVQKHTAQGGHASAPKLKIYPVVRRS